jgi:hypothetical protein
MRGNDEQQGEAFSYVTPETRIPKDHPLRAIRTMTDRVLRELSPRFEAAHPIGALRRGGEARAHHPRTDHARSRARIRGGAEPRIVSDDLRSFPPRAEPEILARLCP